MATAPTIVMICARDYGDLAGQSSGIEQAIIQI